MFFDGYCGLCNRAIAMLLRWDKKGVLKFAPLNGTTAGRLLEETKEDTIVFVSNGKVFTRSTAALRIVRCLDFPYSLLFGLMIFPRPLRDAVYKWIALNRYKWFGKSDLCRLPAPEEQQFFLP